MNNDMNYRNLASAIILQAIRDFCVAVRDNDQATQKEVTRFFNSEWGGFLVWDNNIKIDTNELRLGVRKFISIARSYFDSLNTEGIKKCDNKPYFKCPICKGNVRIRYGMNTTTRGRKLNYYGYKATCNDCHFFDYVNYETRPMKGEKTK